MMNGLRGLITGVLLVSSAAIAQQPSLQLKTIPDSINFIWKNIEQDFAALAEAMPVAVRMRHRRSESRQDENRDPGIPAQFIHNDR